MKLAFLIFSGLTALCLTAPAYAQVDRESHTVTVEVEPATGFVLSRSTIELSLELGTFAPGQTTMTATDESTLLVWITNRRNQKMTVHTDRASPSYTLRVQAVGATAGVALPEVTLSSTPRDLIRNMGKSAGLARIRYTGAATPEQGTGVEEHIVTFTITSE